MILKTLHRQGHPLASPHEQLRVLQTHERLRGPTFDQKLKSLGITVLERRSLTTLQINLGKVCNQTCTHCHVDAGPDRRESMSKDTAIQVLDFLARSDVKALDITGGAPEMNSNFRMLVEQTRRLEKEVIDRCNLTILLANGFTDLPVFLAEHAVTIVASLPCYLEENCDAQRGSGVFVKSIEAIRILNELGYGRSGSGLRLNLVYNPTGQGLPPEQNQLEDTYRRELDQRFGIQFNRLFTITNMPVSRFLEDLLHKEQYDQYMHKLINQFNPVTISDLMCRSLLSVDWKGFLYDCDFNQMLELAISVENKPLHISQLNDELILGRAIEFANHCYGCTAGCGSSCTGSLISSG